MPFQAALILRYRRRARMPDYGGFRRSARVSGAAVLWDFRPVGHSVIAKNLGDAQAIVGEHTRATTHLRFTVLREIAPALHRFLVAPE